MFPLSLSIISLFLFMYLPICQSDLVLATVDLVNYATALLVDIAIARTIIICLLQTTFVSLV